MRVAGGQGGEDFADGRFPMRGAWADLDPLARAHADGLVADNDIRLPVEQ